MAEGTLTFGRRVPEGYRIASIKDVRDLTAGSSPNRMVLEEAPVWQMRLHDGYLDTKFGFRLVRKFREHLTHKVSIKLPDTIAPSGSDAGSMDAAGAEVALMYALEDENEDEISELLTYGSNDLTWIERILYDPPSVKLGFMNGGTPIHYCAWRGKLTALNCILKFVPQVREKLGTLLDNDGDNALVCAIEREEQEVVERLVRIAGETGGKLITHCNHEGENAIMFALKMGNYAAFDTMWEECCKNCRIPSDDDKAGQSLLLHHWASCRESNATDGITCKRVGETLLQHFQASSAAFAVDAFGRTPLMVALRSKNRHACDLLLEHLKPGDYNTVAATCKDREGDTILHCYARSGLPAKFFLRLQKLLGMSDEVSRDSWVEQHLINVRNNKGETPLMIAAKEYCRSSVRALWRIGRLDLEVQDEEGNTALHYLAQMDEQPNSSQETAEVAEEQEGNRIAEVAEEQEVKRIAEVAEEQEGNRSFVKELLLQRVSGENWMNVLGKQNKQGFTAVATAALVGSLELLIWFLECAPGLLADCKVLCCCLASGRAETLQVFLKASKLSCPTCAPAEYEECSCNLVSKWMKDASGLSLLHHAALGGNPDLFLRVLDYDQSQIKHEDPFDGHTPLFWLLRHNSGNDSFLKRVLSLSIPADALQHRDRRGRTLLFFASEEDVVRQLLSYGLQADARDNDGETVMHVACRSGDPNLIQFWLGRDIRVRCDTSSGTQEDVRLSDVRDYAGETPLHEAVRSKQLHAANLLLNAIQPDLLDDQQRDEDGRTVLHWAVTVAANTDEDQGLMVNYIQEQAFLITEMLLEYARQDSRHAGVPENRSAQSEPGYMDLLLATSAGPSIGNALENVHPSFSSLKVLLEARMSETVPADDALVRKALRYGYNNVAKQFINRGFDITLLEPEDQKKVTDEVLTRSSDQPSHEDFLGRIEIAKGVAALLLNPFTDTPITIGIFGHWGIGKSSVMLQVEKILLLTLCQKMLKQRKQIMRQFTNLMNKDPDTPEAFMNKFLDEYRKEWFPLYRGLAFGDVNKRVNLMESKKRSFNILSILTTRNKTDEQQQLPIRSLSIPSVLTVRYNAWLYQNEAEAGAGLALRIIREMESFFTTAQWLRCCWEYAWCTRRSFLIVNFILPVALVLLVGGWVAWLIWTLLSSVSTDKLSTLSEYRYGSIPITVLITTWLVLRNVLNTIQPVTQQLLESSAYSGKHEKQLGYHQQVIDDINFFKQQLCSRPSWVWATLGLFWAKKNYMDDHCKIRKIMPPTDPKDLRIIVFIDDLDRCYKENFVLQMVGAVHLILSECEINVVFGVSKEMIQRAIDNQLKTLAGEKDQSTKTDESGSGKMDEEINADTFLAKIIQVPIDLSQPSTKSMDHFLSAQLGVQNKGKDGGVRSSDRDSVRPEMQQCNEDHLSIQFKAVTRNVASTDQFIVHSPVLFAQYNESEVRAFKYLLTKALGRNSQPRQWKRLLGYHRLAWNIISQREGVKRIAGWQRQLTVWVFVCWQWKDEMNYIIEHWHGLVKPPPSAGHISTRGLITKQAPQEPSKREAGAENSADAENQKKEQPTENAAGSARLDQKMAPNSLRRVVKDAMNEVKKEACSEQKLQSWTHLEETLSSGGSEGYDVSMEALQIFQDFRFHCRVDYIECSGC